MVMVNDCCCVNANHRHKCCSVTFKMMNILYIIIGIAIFVIGVVISKVFFKLTPYWYVIFIVAGLMIILSVLGNIGSGYSYPVKIRRLKFLRIYFIFWFVFTFAFVIITPPIMLSTISIPRELNRLLTIYRANSNAIPAFFSKIIENLLTSSTTLLGGIMLIISAVFLLGLIMCMVLMSPENVIQSFNFLSSFLLTLLGIAIIIISIILYNTTILVRSHLTLFLALVLFGAVFAVIGVWGIFSACIVEKSTKPSLLNLLLVALVAIVYAVIVVVLFTSIKSFSTIFSPLVAQFCSAEETDILSTTKDCSDVSSEFDRLLCYDTASFGRLMDNCIDSLLILDLIHPANGSCSCETLESATILQSIQQFTAVVTTSFTENASWAVTAAASVGAFLLFYILSNLCQVTYYRLDVDEDGVLVGNTMQALYYQSTNLEPTEYKKQDETYDDD
ncbi:hypothetical protein BLNAU_7317 [Blattamonas nauphoetae]|uniref:Uncharacterized protein n=1 Tax=Blattamonas nauphoetae TaxID=2049346 RepID=A0ABQ9Y1Q3_9EUKA|nr:hypothetical protein BLNAU_7317 [Blattamonas nauphoetae]